MSSVLTDRATHFAQRNTRKIRVHVNVPTSECLIEMADILGNIFFFFFFSFHGERSARVATIHRAGKDGDATFGTGPHYFSYFLTICLWTRGDSEVEEEPLALLEVRRRGKRPAAIVWSRLNKRRYHRTRLLVPRPGCLRILTYRLASSLRRDIKTSLIPGFRRGA